MLRLGLGLGLEQWPWFVYEHTPRLQKKCERVTVRVSARVSARVGVSVSARVRVMVVGGLRVYSSTSEEEEVREGLGSG